MPLRVCFRWMARITTSLHNPASAIGLPRTPQQLLNAMLSASEAEQIVPSIAIVHRLRARPAIATDYEGLFVLRLECVEPPLHEGSQSLHGKITRRRVDHALALELH